MRSRRSAMIANATPTIAGTDRCLALLAAAPPPPPPPGFDVGVETPVAAGSGGKLEPCDNSAARLRRLRIWVSVDCQATTYAWALTTPVVICPTEAVKDVVVYVVRVLEAADFTTNTVGSRIVLRVTMSVHQGFPSGPTDTVKVLYCELVKI
jgi:hypothetical protein